MPTSSEFANAVRKRRKELKLTLTDLSNRTNISVPYLSELERGTKQPPLGQHLASIADALQMDHQELAMLAAAARRKVEIDIQHAGPGRMGLAMLLARRVEDGGISEEEAEAIIQRIEAPRRGAL